MSRKIIGITVGTSLPKPNFDQTDPSKGDYIKNKPDFEGLKSKVDTISDLVGDTKVSEQIHNSIDGSLSISGMAADAKVVGDALAEKLDKSIMSDIENFVHESIYGLVDGTIENISNNKATYVRDYSFYQHYNLITADFSTATSIGNYSFYKCPVLTSVNAPSAISIGNFAFKGCSSLTSANYPLVTTIGQGCFDECTSLSSVNLPVVTRIEPLTFRKCQALSAIDLLAVTSIGSQAFYNSGISSLTLRSNTVVTLESADAFYFTPIEEGTGYIYVPSALVNSYKVADGWSTYANQIRAIV